MKYKQKGKTNLVINSKFIKPIKLQFFSISIWLICLNCSYDCLLNHFALFNIRSKEAYRLPLCHFDWCVRQITLLTVHFACKVSHMRHDVIDTEGKKTLCHLLVIYFRIVRGFVLRCRYKPNFEPIRHCNGYSYYHFNQTHYTCTCHIRFDWENKYLVIN